MSHIQMPKEGSKNCLVTGNMSAMITRVEMAVFVNGPGEGIMHREKIPRMISSRY